MAYTQPPIGYLRSPIGYLRSMPARVPVSDEVEEVDVVFVVEDLGVVAQHHDNVVREPGEAVHKDHAEEDEVGAPPSRLQILEPGITPVRRRSGG